LWGVPTGVVSGIDVLDIDPDGLGWFEANRHRIPVTRVHRTPRGGLHLFFKHAPGLRCSRGRIDTWLSVYCGADDNSLNRAFGRKFLLAAVRRVKQPGCKFDNIMVLESKQGTLKSTLGRVLAGDENFSDADILESDKREQQELCEGTWIYEIAELSGLHKSDVEKVKAFASRQEDKARPAYARRVSIRKRTCVFFGTTNSDQYLQDQTGNRRFWPVPIIKVDIEAVRRDRDQLWAEAVVSEATGEALYLSEELWPDAEARQESRLIPDLLVD